MGMTVTEKILAAHSGNASVQPGQNVWCDVDVLMSNDVIAPQMIGVFEERFGRDAKVWDPEKVVLIPDHYIFTGDGKAHRNIDIMRDFVKRKGITNYYDPEFIDADLPDGSMPPAYANANETSYKGVCHLTLPQSGHVRPGELLLGTDSHTCTHGAFGQFATGIGSTDGAFVLATGKLWLKIPQTLKFVLHGQVPPYLMAKDIILHIIGSIGVDGATYCAMEFGGEAIARLNIDERMTICNMVIEAGAKNGVIPADRVAMEYVRTRTDKHFEPVTADPDAQYAEVHELDVSDIEPTVACPHSPEKRATARELSQVNVDRVYIGSCTGGKTTDFIAAARILVDKQVQVETCVVPATTEIDADLDRCTVAGKTLREILISAGCRLAPASCAACLGGPVDTFGRANEAMNIVSTTNRNFPGRMGHKQASVYLASPLTAAASALTGKITDPRDYVHAASTVGAVE